MSLSFSTTSSAAADDFGALSLTASGGPLSTRSTTYSPSPSPTPGPSSGTGTTTRKRRERQTRLQEHLRTVKPPRSTPPAKPSSSSRSAHKTVPREMAAAAHHEPDTLSLSSRPKRKAAQKVVMQEFDLDSEPESTTLVDDEGEDDNDDDDDDTMHEQDDGLDAGAQRSGRGRGRGRDGESETKKSATTGARRSRGSKAPPTSSSKLAAAVAAAAAAAAKVPREREISSLSTVSAGIDVEGMDEDEVQDRLQHEKNELMQRLAQHG